MSPETSIPSHELLINICKISRSEPWLTHSSTSLKSLPSVLSGEPCEGSENPLNIFRNHKFRELLVWDLRNRCQEVARNNRVLGHFISVRSQGFTRVLCLYPHGAAFPAGRNGTKSVFNLQVILIKTVF